MISHSSQRPRRPLMNVREAAKYLSLSEDALRSMVQRRQIPFIKMGDRRIRFDPDELDRWLDAQRVGPLQFRSA